MSGRASAALRLHLKKIHERDAILQTLPQYRRSHLLTSKGTIPLSTVRCLSGVVQTFHRTQNCRIQQHCCWFSSDVKNNADEASISTEGPCPQGIQGDDCETFKLWLESCQRYGRGDCNNQLQGIQSGRKTLAEVLAEQDKFIAEVAEQYRTAAASSDHSRNENSQGTQDFVTASLKIDAPCPQGVQGSDCAHFKLWLENCHRFGLEDCSQNLKNFKTGRNSLAEIFAQQDQVIRHAANIALHKTSTQKREYSTSTKNSGSEDSNKPSSGEGANEEVQLTQRQKLKRAVKEYGSTVIVFHVTISLMSLGFFYLLVSSGIDVIGLLMKVGIGGSLLQSKLAAGTGTFVVAYAVHKVFAPLRIATTLTATPFIVRYLRRVGFLKVPDQFKSKQS